VGLGWEGLKNRKEGLKHCEERQKKEKAGLPRRIRSSQWRRVGEVL